MLRLFTQLAPAASRTETQHSLQFRRFLAITSDGAGDFSRFSRVQSHMGASPRLTPQQTPRINNSLGNGVYPSGDSSSPSGLPACPRDFRCDVGQAIGAQYGRIIGIMREHHAELKSDVKKVGEELKSDMAKTEGKLESTIEKARGELKLDMALVKDELSGDLRELKADMVKTEEKLESKIEKLREEVNDLGRKTHTLITGAKLAIPVIGPLIAHAYYKEYKSFTERSAGETQQVYSEPSQVMSGSLGIGKVEQKK